jgi:hypothetical protein
VRAGDLKEALDRAALRIAYWRGLQRAILDRKGSRMSMLDKIDGLIAARSEFNAHAELRLEGLRERYAKAPAQLDAAVDRHHTRLDAEGEGRRRARRRDRAAEQRGKLLRLAALVAAVGQHFRVMR